MVRSWGNECSSLFLLNSKKRWSLSEKQGNETAPPRPAWPGARMWQCPLPIADLPVSASFSVFSIDTSRSMCEITCLVWNSSGHVQDETAVLVANDVWGSEAGLHLQAAGATHHLSQVFGKNHLLTPPAWANSRAEWTEHSGCQQLLISLWWQQCNSLPLAEGELFKHQMSRLDFVILRKITFFHCWEVMEKVKFGSSGLGSF